MSIHRIMLAAAVVFGLGSAATVGPYAAGESLDDGPGGLTLDQHDIDIGAGQHQTVVTGFLTGGTLADLAVARVDADGSRHLRIYTYDDATWAPAFDVPLGPDVHFIDVGHIDGHDRLIAGGADRLSWLDLESDTEHLLVSLEAHVRPPARPGVPHVDVTRDLNGDGRDDLLVPDARGFRVFVQTPGGAFAGPVHVGTTSNPGALFERYGYRHAPWRQSRVHEVDYDLDGRTDLVYWNQDHFEVHRQRGDGLFEGEPVRFTTEVPFDSDDLASLAAPGEARGRLKDHGLKGEVTGRVLHSLPDVDGDGVADLVVFSLKGGSLWSMDSAYEVYFGSVASNGGTVFAAKAGAVIESGGIPFAVEQHDFDHDGQLDVMYMTIDPGVFKVVGMVVGAVFAHSVPVDLELHRMDGGAYANKPTLARSVRSDLPRGKDVPRTTRFPVVLLLDVNGDDRLDLLVGRSRKALRVYPGVPGPELFARRPEELPVTMPAMEEFVWTFDLDGDGRRDMVMHHPSSDVADRVTMLLAQ